MLKAVRLCVPVCVLISRSFFLAVAVSPSLSAPGPPCRCLWVSSGPEWFLSFLLRALEAYRPLLLLFSGDAQPAHTDAAAAVAASAASAGAVGQGGGETQTGAGGGSGDGGGGWGAGGVDPVAYFARGLTLLARSVLLTGNRSVCGCVSVCVLACVGLLCFERVVARNAGRCGG